MWGLQRPRFLGAVTPRLPPSVVRLRNRWLQRGGSPNEQAHKPVEQSALTSSDVSASCVSTSARQLPGEARRSRRASPPSAAAASAAASFFPSPPNNSSSSNSGDAAATVSSEQDLSLELDFVPILGPLREALCVLAAVLLTAALYGITGRWHGGSLVARLVGVVAAASFVSLLRTAWMEKEYKARERAFAALGDADSHFRPISAALAAAAGGSSQPHHHQLVVHVKVKTGGDLAPRGQQSHATGDISLGSSSARADDTTTTTAAASSSSPPALPAAAGAGAPARDHLYAVHCYHGFGANLGSYKRVQARLASALQGVVTAHDMPGFGLTQRPSDTSSYFLTFNGRLGRLVVDYELWQLGLMAGAGAATAAAAPAVKRILVGHSLGGACAALEALAHPDGLAGLVLVAPAIFALPGPEYQHVTLTPDPPPGAATAAATARLAAQPGAEPFGSHVTDPPTVRRLYPRGHVTRPPPTAGSPGNSGNSGSSSEAGMGNARGLRGLLRAAGRLLAAAASLALLALLQLLTPVITLLLRMVVRQRTFWMKGLQQAYYNPASLTADLVDAYRLPQLVRGWEAGMVNFLLARLARPRRAGLRELFRDAAKGSRNTVAAAAAAAVTGGPAAAVGAAGTATAAAAVDAEAEAVTAGPLPPSPNPAPMLQPQPSPNNDDDTDLASRLATLVATRRLPVLLLHGLHDRLVPAFNSQRLARMLGAAAPPGCCELVLLERCGHMPQEELPELWVELVTEWAERVGARGEEEEREGAAKGERTASQQS